MSPSAPLRAGLSVATLSLPYMATLASRQDAPLLMQSAFESWPQPFREPFSLFLEASGGLQSLWTPRFEPARPAWLWS